MLFLCKAKGWSKIQTNEREMDIIEKNKTYAKQWMKQAKQRDTTMACLILRSNVLHKKKEQ